MGNEIIQPFSQETASSITHHKTAMEWLLAGKDLDELGDFLNCGWFGRGQQYVSFTRNVEY